MPTLRTRLIAGSAALAAGLAGVAVLAPAGPASATRVEAACSDAAGDAATIQAAIDSSKEGDEIVIKGPCLIDATISLADRRTYRGDAKAGTVGLLLRSWNTRVYDLDIYGTPSDGIRISNPSRNGTTLRNTMVNSVISDVYIEGAAEAGIRVVDPGDSVTDWTLQRSWIGFSGTHAIQSDNAAGWTMSGLHLYATPKNAIDAHRCFGTSIEDNYIEDFGAESTAGQTYYGIRCDLQGDAATTITGNRVHKFLPPPNALAELRKARQSGSAPPERKFAATGPLPDGVDFVYMALDAVNYAAGHAAITGNTVVGHGTKRETGILLAKGEGESMSVASSGNLLDGVGVRRKVGAGVRLTRGY
ncbi:hypothetical protein ACFFV7_08700 [Nonomuraea spiralis]|uniref:Right handed beta helix domain-containing protein n=1 Tax=Nonomuraea spiralis TaxID=46182 RepID=A0ABV5IB21_9ACTN|nr:hypothetical protein [Nonomuraea spiralis]GGT06370.1 hypothetical protein GCM10010176_058470 [Nonomuraea spiralis]